MALNAIVVEHAGDGRLGLALGEFELRVLELQDRLELDPEKVSTDQLLDTIKLTADRTGNGPKQTNVNVNVNLGDRMKAARERAALPPPSTQRAGANGASHETPLAPTILDGEFTEVEK